MKRRSCAGFHGHQPLAGTVWRMAIGKSGLAVRHARGVVLLFGAKEVTAFHLYKMYLNLDHYIHHHNKQRQRGSGGRKGR